MVAEDNSYLKFKVDKLRQQNKELKETCKDLENKITMQDARLQTLESSMMQVFKHIPLNIYSDVNKVRKKLNIIFISVFAICHSIKFRIWFILVIMLIISLINCFYLSVHPLPQHQVDPKYLRASPGSTGPGKHFSSLENGE